MKILSIPCPEEVILPVEASQDVGRFVALMAALKLFELGRLSAGKAARFAGLSRPEFFEMCGRYRVSLFNYPPEELDKELDSDVETLRRAAS